MAKKPNIAAIRRAVPLTALPTRRDDPRVCGICGVQVDPDDLPCTAWREHDEQDRPIRGVDALVFIGSGKEHEACRKAVTDHPRLYAEVQGEPGAFPTVCGPCIHRRDLVCTHRALTANGGHGLLITLQGSASMIVCVRGTGCHTPVRLIERCAGRETTKQPLTDEQKARAKHPGPVPSDPERCSRCGLRINDADELCPAGFWLNETEQARWREGQRWEGT